MSTPPRLVVRQHAPWRWVIISAVALAAAVVAIWFAYELGGDRAGFDGSAARAARAKLQQRIDDLEHEARVLRLKVATYETDHAGQTRERTELSKTIGDLQAEVARLTSELAFYKGVVGDRADVQVVRIQQFSVSRGAKEGEYLLRLVLGRPLRAEDAVNGKVKVVIEGSRGGADTTLDLATIAAVPGGELPFSYRHVQELQQVVSLPADFTPARTTVEVAPARKGVNPVRETFLWNVED